MTTRAERRQYVRQINRLGGMAALSLSAGLPRSARRKLAHEPAQPAKVAHNGRTTVVVARYRKPYI